MSFRHRLDRFWEKNGEEARALTTGRMPGFVLGRAPRPGEAPIFVFHDVNPDVFDAQLRYLKANGYETLAADALLASGVPPKSVVLTFDDATWTFAAYAFPLLRRHGFRAVLFAIPGLVPDDETVYPSLDDVTEGRSSYAEVASRRSKQVLCTRRELAAMHASGSVDIQSHSMTHQRVPVTPDVLDFIHPGFDADTYGNVLIPVSVLDDPRAPARRRRLGAPVFRSASRLAGRPRFVEARAMLESFTCDGRFFEAKGWRRELQGVLATWPVPRRGAYETGEEMESAIRWEVAESKRALEAMLPGKTVRHLCYPWFQGSPLADCLAAEAGYDATYYGLLPGSPPRGTRLRTFARVSETYLLRLPGKGRRSIARVWRQRLGI